MSREGSGRGGGGGNKEMLRNGDDVGSTVFNMTHKSKT